ncbi:MAG: L-threonylcarbamoyladenylate synthase [Pseudomonadota bacterium]
MPDFYTHLPLLSIAAKTMKKGGVIAYPTEGVWGLGCDPFNQCAVARLLSLKKRLPNKGVILVAASIQQVDFLIHDLSAEQQHRLNNTWPGPFTWIIPHKNRVPPWICGDHAGVAVRVSAHPVVNALCRLYGGAIVSTSANPQALPAATSAWKVQRYFRNDPRLDLITPGTIGKRARPSTIQDISSLAVIRR